MDTRTYVLAVSPNKCSKLLQGTNLFIFKKGRHSRQNIDSYFIVNGPKVGPKWFKIHQKGDKIRREMSPQPAQMTPCGPLVGLSALLCPTGASKSRLLAHFGRHLGSLWVARGVIWGPFGDPLGTFAYKKASVFTTRCSASLFAPFLGDL